MNPAAAYTSDGGNLTFKNLCGIVKLSLTGSDAISKIVLTGADNLSGQATVALSAGDPVLTMTGTNGADKTVTLNISPAVTLTGTATDFYIVIPPTSKGFRVTIYDAAGSQTKATSSVINRNKILLMPGLTYTADSPTDLSGTAKGTANCYIPSGNAGKYKFKATVMGNGTDGIIDGGNFPTADAAIAPVSAALLWQDVPGLISDVTLIDDSGVKYVTFNASKSVLEGNAVIAVYDQADGTGNILWSWHIWCTDQPADQSYRVDGTLFLLDRNLGATSATLTDGVATYGLLYQWGRKDPFPGSDAVNTNTEKNLYKRDGTKYKMTDAGYIKSTPTDDQSIAHCIANPSTFYYYNSSDWYYGADSGDESKNNLLWGYNVNKSIYDPCPPGYMVPADNSWNHFCTNGTSSGSTGLYVTDNTDSYFTTNHGWTFRLPPSSTSWYSAAGSRSSLGTLTNLGAIGNYWSNHASYLLETFVAGSLYFKSNSINTQKSSQRVYAYSIRCQAQ